MMIYPTPKYVYYTQGTTIGRVSRETRLVEEIEVTEDERRRFEQLLEALDYYVYPYVDDALERAFKLTLLTYGNCRRW